MIAMWQTDRDRVDIRIGNRVVDLSVRFLNTKFGGFFTEKVCVVIDKTLDLQFSTQFSDGLDVAGARPADTGDGHSHAPSSHV